MADEKMVVEEKQDDQARFHEMMRIVKILFGCRIALWIVAAGATVYWMYWSEVLYKMDNFDVYLYGEALRPHFTKGLLVSIVALIISTILRKISDNVKRLGRGY